MRTRSRISCEAGWDIDMKKLFLATLLFSSSAFAQFDNYSAVRVSWDHVPEIDRNNPITYTVYVRLDGKDVVEHGQLQTNTIDLQLDAIGVTSGTKQLCFAIDASRNGTRSELSDFGCVGSWPLSAPGQGVIQLLP